MLKEEILPYIKDQFKRRKVVLEAMSSLEASNIDCHNCPGTCCTFVSNSMQVTVLEGLDLYLYLQENALWNDELEERLKKTIDDFRLNHRPSTGAGQLMRKTYTCPFFGHQALGCPLPREVKPYGCLGFNPSQKNEVSGGSCHSDNELLLKREEAVTDEEEQNHLLQVKLGLPWAKESIPSALIDIHMALK